MISILTVQGIFYLITGLWPILHIKSFEAITGPKRDKWLVQVVGALISVDGYVFLTEHSPTAVKLAILSALALAICDVVFVLRKIIAKVYLADAAVEVLLALLLISVK